MIILVGQEIDEFTFKRLSEIAAGFDVCLRRTNQRKLFSTRTKAKDKEAKLKSLIVTDCLLTCYKSIDRLKKIIPTT